MVAETAAECLKILGGKLPPKHRVYKVEIDVCLPKYVVANSPGKAALAVCAVERLSDKDIMEAALKALMAK